MKRLIIALFISVFAFSMSASDREIKVLINTDKGKIIVKLYNETPQHRDNFVKLVKEHKYDGLLFHRVIKLFMIQAGDINSKDAPLDKKLGDGDLGYTIPAEIIPGLIHTQGKLCAARTSDDVNPERASSATQFYIVTGKYYTDHELDKMEKDTGRKFTDEERNAYKKEGGTPHLDGKYTIFGEVIKGMDVVHKIELVGTDDNDRPTKNIKIKKMKIYNGKKFFFFW